MHKSILAFVALLTLAACDMTAGKEIAEAAVDEFHSDVEAGNFAQI